jgi:uncharacterized membrane protein YkvA (DUF1232 family)
VLCGIPGVGGVQGSVRPDAQTKKSGPAPSDAGTTGASRVHGPTRTEPYVRARCPRQANQEALSRRFDAARSRARSLLLVDTFIWLALGFSAGALLVLAGAAALLFLTVGRDEGVRLLGRRTRALSWRNKLLLAARLARDPRVPLRVRLIPPVVAVYLASPLDIIPDFIPVIGQLDDLLVLAIGAGLMAKFTPAHVLSEHLDRLEGALKVL